MRKGFTLIELLISIVILTILMLFLYKSYASLNRSNIVISQEIQKLQTAQLIKRTLYMDFTLALNASVVVLNQDRKEDVVYLQSSNSLHKRINQYIAYIVKDKKLYRLESLKPYKEYPMASDVEFVSDFLADVKSFRVYEQKGESKSLYLLHVEFKGKEELILKVKVLNAS